MKSRDFFIIFGPFLSFNRGSNGLIAARKPSEGVLKAIAQLNPLKINQRRSLLW